MLVFFCLGNLWCFAWNWEIRKKQCYTHTVHFIINLTLRYEKWWITSFFMEYWSEDMGTSLAFHSLYCVALMVNWEALKRKKRKKRERNDSNRLIFSVTHMGCAQLEYVFDGELGGFDRTIRFLPFISKKFPNWLQYHPPRLSFSFYSLSNCKYKTSKQLWYK